VKLSLDNISEADWSEALDKFFSKPDNAAVVERLLKKCPELNRRECMKTLRAAVRARLTMELLVHCQIWNTIVDTIS